MEPDTARILMSVEALWWLGFFGAFGLCVGSFLNVVIYRIPREISLREPVWSFCPGCHTPIRWYDNLPVIGYLRLGGRCRGCRMLISPRYPMVEMLGALVTLLVFDAFFIADTHAGLAGYAGLTWRVGDDWPIYLAHVVLFTSLLAMSAIDIEHYWVDVRFTTLAAVAGFVVHAAWTPVRPTAWHRPEDGTAVGALVTVVALLVSMYLLRRIYPPHEPLVEPLVPLPAGQDVADGDAMEPGNTFETPAEMAAPDSALPIGALSDPADPIGPPTDTMANVLLDAQTDAPADAQGDAAADARGDLPAKEPSPFIGRLGAMLAGLALAILMVGAWSASSGIGPALSIQLRWGPALVLLVLIIVACGIPHRETDTAIVETIEAERESARRVAAAELLCLLPAVILGGAAIYWGVNDADMAARYSGALRWEPISGWRPLMGLGTAAMGFVVGGGIGWIVRLSATLIMGREAFGTGDIHMMAAAGCVAGWPVVLIGFVLCSLLALGGWILVLPFKRSRAIPLGPWLSISFLIVVLFYDPIMESRTIQNVVDLVNLFVFNKPL